jgi:hypothetical protein
VADRALDVYLNDHLGGAMLGSNLAEQIGERAEGTPLGALMAEIAPQIEEDRQTLIELMEQLDVSKNPAKQASAWLAEKASRLKFGGASSGEPDFGLYMAVETMTLGVRGKLSLWKALKQIASDYPPLTAADLDELIARAQSQHDRLEEQRISLAGGVLSGDVSGIAKLA